MSEVNENVITEENAVTEPVKTEKVEEAVPEVQQKEKKKSKAPFIALICIIAIVAGVVAFAFGSGKGGESDPLFYVKGNSLFMVQLNAPEKEAVEIYKTENKDLSITDVRLNAEKNELLFTVCSEDNEESGTDTVYSYNPTTPENAPEKLLENVHSYAKEEETGIITCIVGEKQKLVQFDAQLNETPISKSVENFELSKDRKKVMYTVSDGGCYLWEKEKGTVMLTEVGYTEYYDEEFTVFYVNENSSLYKVLPTGERTLIDKDVNETEFYGEKGYYFKDAGTIYFKDIFEDDMKDADNEIKIPADTNSEAYKLYTERLTRDTIRAVVLDPENSYSLSDVYYYDGTKSALILENSFSSAYNPVFGDDENYFASSYCSVLDMENVKKITMSELWNQISELSVEEYGLNLDAAFDVADEVVSLIEEPFINYCTDYFIREGDFAADIGVKGLVFDTLVDYINNNLYLVINQNEDDTNILYKFPITETGLGEAEVLSENVSAFSVDLIEDGKLFYTEEVYEEANEEEYLFESTYNVYYDSKLILENVYSVESTNLEEDMFIFSRAKPTEDENAEAEGYDTFIYNLKTGEEIQLEYNEDGWYSFNNSYAGKQLLFCEIYGDYGDSEVKVYSIENGEVKNLGLQIPYPESCIYTNEIFDGYAYSVSDDWLDWEL